MRRAGSGQRWDHIKTHCPTQRVADSGWKDLLNTNCRMHSVCPDAVQAMFAVCFNMVKLFDFNGHTPLVELEVAILKYTVSR